MSWEGLLFIWGSRKESASVPLMIVAVAITTAVGREEGKSEIKIRIGVI